MNGTGPIKQAISNVKARKEEKQRATEQGYAYNRNIIHDVGENKSRNIKGSVADAAQMKLDRAKKDVKKVSSSVKKAVESKVDKMQQSKQARNAMKAADERGKNNRVKTSESGNIKGKFAFEGLRDLLKKGPPAPKKGSSKGRAVKQQAKRSMKNRVS
jgi:hypothetical protein